MTGQLKSYSVSLLDAKVNYFFRTATLSPLCTPGGGETSKWDSFYNRVKKSTLI